MKNYILETMKSNEHGLFLCELPTGYGKTYTVAQIMKAYACDPQNKRKIVYLTTLNKNLPEDELLTAFGEKELYHKAVLRIRSNFDEVIDKLEDVIVPDEFQTDHYEKLLYLVRKYNQTIKNKAVDKEYINDLKKRVNEAEQVFRRELSRWLTRKFRNKPARLTAIKTDPHWKWIGKLYPAVFTDDYPILLMSISKFMKRNSCIVEPSYEFLQSTLLENAIIFIDEFDATKATIQDILIERALSVNEEYIFLFKQILRGMNPEYFSKSMTTAYKKAVSTRGKGHSFETIRQEAVEIEEKYCIHLSYKTIEDDIDRHQNFLFKDATYHTLFHDDKKYIRANVDKEENRIKIYFEDHNDFYKKRNENEISVYALLRDINSFLRHFRIFLFAWARNYKDEINAHRCPDDDEMTLENACSSILKKLELSQNQQILIMGETCHLNQKTDKKELLPDNSFYQQGMEIFELEDNDSHYDSTDLRLVAIYDTPEKILVYLAEKATVYGISATAEVPSVIGNYDLGYLEEKLGQHYHVTPQKQKERIQKELSRTWKAYYDGHIHVHAEIVKNHSNCLDVDYICEEIFISTELAQICAAKIKNAIADVYYEMRYCNIAKAMHAFLETKGIQSMLYLGMALPVKDHPELDIDLLNDLFDLSSQDILMCDMLEEAEQRQAECAFHILRSENYEEEKKRLLDRLSKGEKIFIMSSYQTIGAGQNLQYKIADKSDLVELVPDTGNCDNRHFYKDIDAIYLGDATNLTVNTYQNQKITTTDLMKLLFQIEELKQNAELNYKEADAMIKLAFRARTSNSQWERNLLYQTKSVRLQATRLVMQAIGRMCRTYVKSPDIYIFIEERFLEKLYAGEMKKHILSPEMEAIVYLREQLGSEYSNEEETMLKQAEKISSYGMWSIRQYLARNWTADSMKLWEQLRTLVLSCPTASKDQREGNKLIQKLYITSGKPQDRYLYSQYSDFNDVTIDFSNDIVGFRNSGRAKKKANTEEVLVYEMSEQNSGLPILLKYPGMEKYFLENGYAAKFVRADFMMSPVLFHNIYKGALGETAGKFILEKELGIHLSPITDFERFEFFDFEMAPGVYVDFKNWKYTYLVERESVRKEILHKLDHIGGKRVYVINVIGHSEFHEPTVQVDRRIIEIPGILDHQGRTIYKYLKMINEEDFR